MNATTYVLVDRIGSVREMAAERAPIRVPMVAPMGITISDEAPASTPYTVIDFCDSGFVDDRGYTILTPDGKDVPLGKIERRVFRRGRQFWADVYVSDCERHNSRPSLHDLLWMLAEGSLRAMVPDRSVLLAPLDVCEINQVPSQRCSAFRVFAESRIPVEK